MKSNNTRKNKKGNGKRNNIIRSRYFAYSVLLLFFLGLAAAFEINSGEISPKIGQATGMAMVPSWWTLELDDQENSNSADYGPDGSSEVQTVIFYVPQGVCNPDPGNMFLNTAEFMEGKLKGMGYTVQAYPVNDCFDDYETISGKLLELKEQSPLKHLIFVGHSGSRDIAGMSGKKVAQLKDNLTGKVIDSNTEVIAVACHSAGFCSHPEHISENKLYKDYTEFKEVYDTRGDPESDKVINSMLYDFKSPYEKAAAINNRQIVLPSDDVLIESFFRSKEKLYYSSITGFGSITQKFSKIFGLRASGFTGSLLVIDGHLAPGKMISNVPTSYKELHYRTFFEGSEADTLSTDIILLLSGK